jgi:chorismate dehydratase
MNIRVGFIPYLNMVPFHQGFGPEPIEIEGHRFEFQSMSPRVMGLEAEKGSIDAGALSLVDGLRFSGEFEPLGTFGIGLKRPALSVLLFSKKPMSELRGVCAVTDETSTSFRLLQVLLEVRYGLTGVTYGRIASSMLFDGEADAVLLIGDEALKAKKESIRGLPVVTDLGEEWYSWQGYPFVFARWMVRRSLPKEVKAIILRSIQNSLYSSRTGTSEELNYWNGFAYKLTAEHEKSIQKFKGMLSPDVIPAGRKPGSTDPPLTPAGDDSYSYV